MAKKEQEEGPPLPLETIQASEKMSTERRVAGAGASAMAATEEMMRPGVAPGPCGGAGAQESGDTRNALRFENPL